MNAQDLLDLEKIELMLVASMTGYMRDSGDSAGYSLADIEKCQQILKRYIDSLLELGSEATDPVILERVKEVVLDLNELNASVNCCLIETFEREELFSYIDLAARRSGLQTPEADVTEKWREW
jgi:hypothetical protein